MHTLIASFKDLDDLEFNDYSMGQCLDLDVVTVTRVDPATLTITLTSDSLEDLEDLTLGFDIAMDQADPGAPTSYRLT